MVWLVEGRVAAALALVTLSPSGKIARSLALALAVIILVLVLAFALAVTILIAHIVTHTIAHTIGLIARITVVLVAGEAALLSLFLHGQLQVQVLQRVGCREARDHWSYRGHGIDHYRC
jgi:hypothetical protein